MCGAAALAGRLFRGMVTQLGVVFEEAAPVENASLDVADWSSRVGGDRPAEGEEWVFQVGFFSLCVTLQRPC